MLPASPAVAKLLISAVVVTVPSVLSILISPLLPPFICVCVVAVVLLFSGSPAVERVVPVVISPFVSIMILPPEPSRENDCSSDSPLVPAVVLIVPPAFRVILPPLPLGEFSESSAAPNSRPAKEEIFPVVILPLLVRLTVPAFPLLEEEASSPLLLLIFPLLLSRVILPP